MSKKFIENFCKQLKERRLSRGMTQSQLAKILSVSLRTYQRIESCEAFPTIQFILNASDMLGLKLSESLHPRESTNESNKLDSLAGLGKWSLDISNNVLRWSKVTFEIFELDPKHFETSYEAFLDIIHPEDRELVNFTYTNSLKTKLPYEVEHRLLMKDGRIKWVLEKCETTFDESGNPLISTGYCLDITRFKKN